MTSRRHIAWDARTCTGCRLCEAACSLERAGGVAPALAAIRIGETDVRVCRQCDPAPCAGACPVEALDGGRPSEACLGCGLCVVACACDAIFQPTPQAPPIRCDLCGGVPRCVAICPTGALALVGAGRWAALGRRVRLEWQRLKTEIGLVLKTRSNLVLLRLASRRIARVRAKKPVTWHDRWVLDPMVRPFEKSFPATPEKE